MSTSLRKLAFLSIFLILVSLISLQSILIRQVSASPTAKMYVDPPSQTVSASFTVDINATDVVDLYDWEFRLNYSTSLITATSVTEGPFLKSDIGTIWVSDGGDFIYTLYDVDPETTAGSWDTGTSYPMGVEYVDGFLYYVDTNDNLYNKTLSGGDGSPASWDMGGFSGDPYGLAWNGTHFFIADRGDDVIYIVDPADPTTSVGSITYTGIGYAEGVAFDGTYLWVSDTGKDTIFQIDYAGAIQTSWAAPGGGGDPNGITWDGTYLWICDSGTDLIYKCSTTGTVIASYTAPSGASEGLACLFGPRSTFYLSQVDDANGRVVASCTMQGHVPGITGGGVLATVNFDIDANGDSNLDLHRTQLEGYNFTTQSTYRITHVPYDGTVTTTGAVPEFPFGAVAEIAIAGVVIYIWWRKRKPRFTSSLTSPR